MVIGGPGLGSAAWERPGPTPPLRTSRATKACRLRGRVVAIMDSDGWMRRKVVTADGRRRQPPYPAPRPDARGTRPAHDSADRRGDCGTGRRCGSRADGNPDALLMRRASFLTPA